MPEETTKARLDFLQAAEALKNVLRSGHTSTGRPESTAEHTWRLCLMAIVFEDGLAGLDMLKVLKLCIVHDLAEAISGDIPAIAQVDARVKREQEQRDLLQLTEPLDTATRQTILSLWEEYDAAATPEARAVKAMDKLETILQHNQGDNPSDFDYAFNLAYGRQHTASHPLFAEIRALVDAGTRSRINIVERP